MSVERDPDFDAISEKDIYEEARDRLQICLDSESTERSKARYDIQFREGLNHWDENATTSVSEETPELTINLTDALCTRVENNLREQEMTGKAHPVGDGGDIDIAEIINGIGRHVEVRSEATTAYDQASKSAITNGWGYFRLLAEWETPKSFKKDLRIVPIRNIFSVYMDPGAIMPSGCDQNWNLISIKMKRTEYKRRYPRMDNIAWSDVGYGEGRLDWEEREEIRLAEYFRITDKAQKLYELTDRNGETSTRFAADMPSPESMMRTGLRITDERDSSRRQVEWFRLNGTRVIEREILPGTFIPIFRVEGNVVDIDGQIMRRGMVRAMIDPQRMVDFGEVAKIKRLGLSPQAPWVAAEGQLDGHPEWENNNTRPVSVLTYKPITVVTSQGEIPLPPPQRQPPAQIEAGFSEFVQGMRTNLLAVSGAPNEPGADKNQVVSGAALDRRQTLSDQSHLQYAKGRTSAVTHCWRVMLEWIPAYFNDPNRVQRIIGADSKPKMVTLNQQDPNDPMSKVLNDLSVGRYDVVMDTGPSFETKRQEGAENLIDLLKIEALAEIIAKTGPDLVFRSIDHPYMQELADRLIAQTPDGLKQIMEELPERARSLVQSFFNENSQLKQALQAAQQEIKLGLQKEHMKAVVKAHDTEETNKTKRHDIEESNKTKRFDTQVKSHTALAVEEIKAGASLMNTHVEAEHHRREAEMMIENADREEA